VITLLSMQRRLIPGTLNAETLDPVCGPQIIVDNRSHDIRVALSNSFGFGGNNCCLVFIAGERL
jgi:3-oxoacyl-[acyl-carrier-protein] synthase I